MSTTAMWLLLAVVVIVIVFASVLYKRTFTTEELALTGVMADKDYTAMYDQIAPYCARFIAVTPDNPRAMAASDLAKVLARYGKPVETAKSVEAGVQRAIDLAGPDGVCLAFGSLYMVGAIREAVKTH